MTLWPKTGGSKARIWAMLQWDAELFWHLNGVLAYYSEWIMHVIETLRIFYFWRNYIAILSNITSWLAVAYKTRIGYKTLNQASLGVRTQGEPQGCHVFRTQMSDLQFLAMKSKIQKVLHDRTRVQWWPQKRKEVLNIVAFEMDTAMHILRTSSFEYNRAWVPCGSCSKRCVTKETVPAEPQKRGAHCPPSVPQYLSGPAQTSFGIYELCKSHSLLSFCFCLPEIWESSECPVGTLQPLALFLT